MLNSLLSVLANVDFPTIWPKHSCLCLLLEEHNILGWPGVNFNLSVYIYIYILYICMFGYVCVWSFTTKPLCQVITDCSRCNNVQGNIRFVLCLDSFLDILNNEDVSSSGEALLYCAGTLKFLSGNSAILRLLLDKNCVGVAQKLIQRLCQAEDTNFTIAGHIFVQVCETQHCWHSFKGYFKRFWMIY